MSNPIYDNNMEEAYKNLQTMRVNEEKLWDFCNNIPLKKLTKHWSVESPIDYNKFSREDKLAFLFVFNSISFSYWAKDRKNKWRVFPETKIKLNRGTWNLIYALDRAIEKNEFELKPEFLEKITENELYNVLKGHSYLPLLKERTDILNELGSVIKKYETFEKFLGTEKNAVGLVKKIVNEIPSFNDSQIYNGKKLNFYKRAQVLTSDIHKLYTPLEGLENLTACADYKLPQFFHWKKILEYNWPILHQINTDVIFSEDHNVVTENRIATLGIAKKMSDYLNVSQMQVNDYVWLEAGKIPKSFKYLKVRTTNF